jgi:imidazolonepropionase-like amidohydrolase
MTRFAGAFAVCWSCAQASPSPSPPAATARPALSPVVRAYVRVDTPDVILAHVEVIDGTGAAPLRDRNVKIADGKIVAISAGADEPARSGTTVLDLRGRTVMPGIVGMHEHLFFMARPDDGPWLFHQMSYSATRLYLANGVTTIRTAGSVEPVTDVKLARAIDRGELPGPHIEVTGPYLDDGPNRNLQMAQLAGPDDARETVAYWAARGVTSFKAYANITRAELGAAIGEAHRRGLTVTGHLCSVTYPEAAELGIDNLEHGFFANTELDAGKQLDVCSTAGGDDTIERMAPDSDDAKRLFATLIAHHVAVTSTLPNAASSAEAPPPPSAAALDAMSLGAREAYLSDRDVPADKRATKQRLLRRGMALERAFVAAGGTLIAGADPVGLGGLIPGFADQREIELLVDAGFPPVEAIRIATHNGAAFLHRDDRIGTIAPGKNADLVVVTGDPAARIADIENVELVFKDGVGYDRAKLLASVRGHYGEF